MCYMLVIRSTWKPAREYIISNDDDCSSSLSYSVHLNRDGYVKFSYQSADTDVMFHFYVSRLCALCDALNS